MKGIFPVKNKLVSMGLGTLLIAGASQALAAPAFCTDVSTDSLGIEGVRVESSEVVPASASLPAHCRITAVTAERVGQDGRDYALRFEMRLPDQWNGDFVHQFNGGNDGSVLSAVGPLLSGNKERTALGEGYAVLSSDAGHDGSAYPEAGLAGGSRFGMDPEARLYYGYKAVEVLTPIAKRIIAGYYDRLPEHSYGVGCSNGGRHAMVAASRLGDQYDGFLVGAPGFNLPKAAIQHALDVQQLSAINGDLRSSLTDADRAVVAAGIIRACDGLDGLSDGIVSDVAACQSVFDIGSTVCEAGQSESCIAPAKAQALQNMYAGPKDARGNQLYSDWAWDPGIAGDNWKLWKVASAIPPWGNNPIIATMGASSLAQVFTTPPTEVEGDPESLVDFLLNFDIARDGDKVYARKGDYHESAISFMTPPDATNPKLKTFRRAGGKMIIFHGVADPVFSYLDTEHWYKELSANYHGKADSFVKLYPVPGMNHCSGGPATDDFNLFEQLVNWVEEGEEPGAVTAGISEANRAFIERSEPDWSSERTRTLCPYPQVATYIGGDPESADSFSCE